MNLVTILRAALLLVAAVGLPLRAWLRYRRKAPPSPASRYVPETLVLIASLGLLLWLQGTPLEAIGLGARPAWRFIADLGVCLAVVLGMDSISIAMTAWRLKKSKTISIASAASIAHSGETLAAGAALSSFIPVTLAGAAWEELCFRAWVLSMMPQTLAWIAAGVAIGTLFFGLQHLRRGMTGVAYSSFFGLVFACLYLLTGNLIAVMIAHASGNLFAASYGARKIHAMRQRHALRTSMFLG